MAVSREERKRGQQAAPDMARLGQIVPDIWPEALRFALDAEGAPGRCRRRACRKAGACQLHGGDGAPLSCAGGISDDAVRAASLAAIFGGVVAMRILHSPETCDDRHWLAEDED